MFFKTGNALRALVAVPGAKGRTFKRQRTRSANGEVILSRSIVTSSLISLIATILLLTLSHFSFFNTLELKSLDFFQKKNAPIGDPEVVVVEVDQESLAALSEQGIRWPWPRHVYVFFYVTILGIYFLIPHT